MLQTSITQKFAYHDQREYIGNNTEGDVLKCKPSPPHFSKTPKLNLRKKIKSPCIVCELPNALMHLPYHFLKFTLKLKIKKISILKTLENYLHNLFSAYYAFMNTR